MSSVHFYYGELHKSLPSFGNLAAISHACYARGKELGFDDIYIDWIPKNAFLWNENLSYKGNIRIPRGNFLPFKYVIPNDKIKVDKNIDISKSNSLFDGCPPLRGEVFSDFICYSYLNKLYEETGNYQELNIKKSNNEPNVIFHHRESGMNKQRIRNVKQEYIKDLFDNFKDRYPIKYYKNGEETNFDNEFDIILPYHFNKIYRLLRIFNNTNLFVSGVCGVLEWTKMLGIPSIFIIPKEFNSDPITEKGWSAIREENPWIIGKTCIDHVNPSKIFILKEGDNIDYEDLFKFTDKFI